VSSPKARAVGTDAAWQVTVYGYGRTESVYLAVVALACAAAAA
jgi:hypothetical protein